MKNRGRFFNTFLVIVCGAIIISFVPVCYLYLKKAAPFYTNAQAAEKLKSNSGDYFEFIVFGDNHAGLIFNDSSTLKLIRRMNREDRFKKAPVDFVASLGDVSLKGDEWDYLIYNKIRGLIKWPVISAIGNHDDDHGGERRFKKYIGDDEFSFTNRNSYFIVINNSSGEFSDAQFAWLEGELQKSSAYSHRFIISHKSPYAPTQQSWYYPESGPWSYPFMKLCEKYKVDMVFAGHEHMFDSQTFGGVQYVVSGGGGMLIHLPYADGGYLHYVVVKVRGDYVSFEVRKIAPPLWEFLTYYMWKEVFYFLTNALY